MDLEFFKILIEDKSLDISNFLSLYQEQNYDCFTCYITSNSRKINRKNSCDC